MTAKSKRTAASRARVSKLERQAAQNEALLPFDLPTTEAKPKLAATAGRAERGRKRGPESTAGSKAPTQTKTKGSDREKAVRPSTQKTKPAKESPARSKPKESVDPITASRIGEQSGAAMVAKESRKARRFALPPSEDAHRSLPFELNKTHQVDCIEAMRKLPDASVDVAVADPPYNASKGGNWSWDNSIKLPGFGGNWSKIMADWDDMPLAEYFVFTMGWLTELKRVVRPSGSIWIHGTYHNIGLINFALQLLSVEIINEVIWFKRNSFPNLSGRRLTASHESILWAHTGGEKRRRYFFAYDKSKSMNCEGDRIKEPGKQMRTVWDIPNNKAREELAFGKHPTQKPVRLLTRMLELSAQPGQLVLVPFAGSGADCVAAQRVGLDFLAFETDPEFVQLANTRVEHEKRKDSVDLGA